MRNIARVVIDNFQVHDHLELDFSNFTAIIGPTNKGKTAIFRAVKWCLYNVAPRTKEGFIKKGTDTARVEVMFDDGLIITRQKGSNSNFYEVINQQGETAHFESFGAGPVEQVISAHGMRELDLFGSSRSLNMHDQLEAPFFIGESPTNKGVVIGNLAKTDTIDLAIKNISSESRAKKSILKDYKSDLKQVKSDLSELKGLTIMDKVVNKSESDLDKMRVINARLVNVCELIERINELVDKKYKLEKDIIDDQDVITMIDNIDNLINCNHRLSLIKQMHDELSRENDRKLKLETITNGIQEDEINDIIKKTNSLIDEITNLKNIKSATAQLNEVNDYRENILRTTCDEKDIDNTISNLSRAIENVDVLNKILTVNNEYNKEKERLSKGLAITENYKNQYINSVSDYKKALLNSKTCPICMNKITESDLKNIEDMF